LLSLTYSVCGNGCVDVICEDVDNIFVSYGKNARVKNSYFARTQSENTQATDKWGVKLAVKKLISLYECT
jgi:hypothetical protein